MSEVGNIFEQLRAAVVARDGDAIEMWLGQLDFSHDEQYWPEELFDQVKRLLLDEPFLAAGPSWHLPKVVSESWDRLTQKQKDQLASIWPAVFDRFADWMGAFVVAEILGERYANEEAFGDLDRLSRTARMPHRALTPYGLRRLARTVTTGPLHDRAVARLQELTADSAPEVRQEALDNLKDLS